ncbi:hypothetical protein JHK84_033273 [Glycine max]|nr:hypothetical protein JHK84_033273 [Glycine max]
MVGLFVKPLFEAMGEQNKGVQAGAAVCMAKMVECGGGGEGGEVVPEAVDYANKILESEEALKASLDVMNFPTDDMGLLKATKPPQETRVQSRGIWCLWKSENWKVEILRSDDQYRINDYVFGQKWTSEEGIINNVQAMMHDLRRLNEELDVLQSSMMVNDSTSKSYWSPPCPGVFKVNCDGVVFIHEAIATCMWGNYQRRKD